MYCLLWDIYEAIIVSEIVSFFFHGKLVMHHEYCSVELSLVVCGTSSRKLGTSGEWMIAEEKWNIHNWSAVAVASEYDSYMA